MKVDRNKRNPFDSIEEPERMPNPGFMCRQFIETHNNLKKFWPEHLCKTQCAQCLNAVTEHHNRKKPTLPDKL